MMNLANVDRVSSYLLTLAALAVAAGIVRRELTARESSEPTRAPVEQLIGWEGLLSYGRELGRPTAPVKLMVFVDLECPACRYFHEVTLTPVLEQFGREVSWVYVHYPLRHHRHARLHARAAECAGAEGKFEAYVNEVFQDQDSLEVWRPEVFADRAGVGAMGEFSRCAAHTVPVPSIELGLRLADSLLIRGTPAVIVNGWRFDIPPGRAELTRVITAIMGGESPFPAARGKR